MLKKFALAFGITFISTIILVVSLLKASEIHYVISQPPYEINKQDASKLEYNISFSNYYRGNILPDNPLWSLKVLRDRLWILVTTDPKKKSELYLLLSEKRLGSAVYLFLNKKTDLALSVLTKAEKYLESSYELERIASRDGKNTSDLALAISNASLFHRRIIENVMNVSTEQAKPIIVLSLDYPKRIYIESSSYLVSLGMKPPRNPFD